MPKACSELDCGLFTSRPFKILRIDKRSLFYFSPSVEVYLFSVVRIDNDKLHEQCIVLFNAAIDSRKFRC